MTPNRGLSFIAVMVVILASALFGQIPSTMPSEKDHFVKEVEELRRLCEAGDTSAATRKLSSLSEELEKENIPALMRATTVQIALRAAIWSPVGEKDELRQVAAGVGLKTITATRAKDTANPEVVQQQLEIVLDVLPRTSASVDAIATDSLATWSDMLAAAEHYSKLADVTLKFPEPPASYKGPFISGMDPSAITDAAFRKEYADFLKRRDERNQNASKCRALADMKEHFLPKLKHALKAAYSGDPEKEKAGSALIERAVSDEAMRAELLKALQSAPATQPVNKSADK
jgi:hypothetical protein